MVPKWKVRHQLGRALAFAGIGTDVEKIARLPHYGDYEDGPLHIEAKIHQMVLTGPYKYSELEKALGSLHDYGENNKSSTYEKKYVRHYSRFYLTIFLKPKPPRPYCLIRLSPRCEPTIYEYKKFLNFLAAGLPDLKVALAEYATDIFCDSPPNVAVVFQLLVRHAFFPYARRRPYSFGGVLNPEGSSRENIVYRAGVNKIYERGRDNPAKKWDYNELDRVRIEPSVPRRKLQQHGIREIDNFASGPHFLEVMLNKKPWVNNTDKTEPLFRFTHFRRSSRLPQVYEAYMSDERKGEPHENSFQFQLVEKRKRIRNVNQYIEKKSCIRRTAFGVLEKALLQAWKSFDEQWEGS